MVTIQTPQGGINLEEDGQPVVLSDTMQNYMQSKCGNIFLAAEVSKALAKDNIISIVGYIPDLALTGKTNLLASQAINPGLMKTELQRHGPKAQGVIMVSN